MIYFLFLLFYKTIPPITKNNSIEESNVDKVRRARDEKRIWKKPLPPKPFLLHLNVIGRTLYIEEYLIAKNAVKNNCDKYFDASLSNLSDSLNESINESEIVIESHQEEKNTVDFVLSDIIRLLQFIS